MFSILHDIDVSHFTLPILIFMNYSWKLKLKDFTSLWWRTVQHQILRKPWSRVPLISKK